MAGYLGVIQAGLQVHMLLLLTWETEQVPTSWEALSPLLHPRRKLLPGA